MFTRAVYMCAAHKHFVRELDHYHVPMTTFKCTWLPKIISSLISLNISLEDSTDLELVKTSMATVVQLNTKFALIGIFDQILGDDETIREKGLQYVCGPLMAMKKKILNPEMEKFLFNLIKKVSRLGMCIKCEVVGATVVLLFNR